MNSAAAYVRKNASNYRQTQFFRLDLLLLVITRIPHEFRVEALVVPKENGEVVMVRQQTRVITS